MTSGSESCANCSSLVFTIRQQLEAFKIIGGLEESLTSTLLITNLEKIVGPAEDYQEIKDEVTSSRETTPYSEFDVEKKPRAHAPKKTHNDDPVAGSSVSSYFGNVSRKKSTVATRGGATSKSSRRMKQSKKILKKGSSVINKYTKKKKSTRWSYNKQISHRTKRKPPSSSSSVITDLQTLVVVRNAGPKFDLKHAMGAYILVERVKLTEAQLQQHYKKPERATIEQVDREIRKVRDGFQCKLCGKHFGKRMVIVTHVRSFHFNERAKCPGCSREFYRISDVRRHQKSSRCKLRW